MSLVRIPYPVRQAKLMQVVIPVTTNTDVMRSEKVPPNGKWPAHGDALTTQAGVHLTMPLIRVWRSLYPGADYHCGVGLFRFPGMNPDGAPWIPAAASVEAASLLVQVVGVQNMDGDAVRLFGEHHTWDEPLTEDKDNGYKHFTLRNAPEGQAALMHYLSKVKPGLLALPLSDVRGITSGADVTLRLWIGGAVPTGTNSLDIVSSRQTHALAVPPRLLVTVAL